jgi:hypothetical protein
MSIVDQVAGVAGAAASTLSSATGGNQQLAQAFEQMCVTIGEESLEGIQKVGQQLITDNQEVFSDDDNSSS